MTRPLLHHPGLTEVCATLLRLKRNDCGIKIFLDLAIIAYVFFALSVGVKFHTNNVKLSFPLYLAFTSIVTKKTQSLMADAKETTMNFTPPLSSFDLLSFKEETGEKAYSDDRREKSCFVECSHLTFNFSGYGAKG